MLEKGIVPRTLVLFIPSFLARQCFLPPPNLTSILSFLSSSFSLSPALSLARLFFRQTSLKASVDWKCIALSPFPLEGSSFFP